MATITLIPEVSGDDAYETSTVSAGPTNGNTVSVYSQSAFGWNSTLRCLWVGMRFSAVVGGSSDLIHALAGVNVSSATLSFVPANTDATARTFVERLYIEDHQGNGAAGSAGGPWVAGTAIYGISGRTRLGGASNYATVNAWPATTSGTRITLGTTSTLVALINQFLAKYNSPADDALRPHSIIVHALFASGTGGRLHKQWDTSPAGSLDNIYKLDLVYSSTTQVTASTPITIVSAKAATATSNAVITAEAPDITPRAQVATAVANSIATSAFPLIEMKAMPATAISNSRVTAAAATVGAEPETSLLTGKGVVTAAKSSIGVEPSGATAVAVGLGGVGATAQAALVGADAKAATVVGKSRVTAPVAVMPVAPKVATVIGNSVVSAVVATVPVIPKTSVGTGKSVVSAVAAPIETKAIAATTALTSRVQASTAVVQFKGIGASAISTGGVTEEYRFYKGTATEPGLIRVINKDQYPGYKFYLEVSLRSVSTTDDIPGDAYLVNLDQGPNRVPDSTCQMGSIGMSGEWETIRSLEFTSEIPSGDHHYAIKHGGASGGRCECQDADIICIPG